MRLSRLTIMVVAALLTASFTLGAADDKKCLPVNLEKNKLAFKGGEKLVFTIHYKWGIINADVAQATMKLDSTVLNGKSCYHGYLRGKTQKIYESVFKLKEDFDCWFSTDTFRPLKFSRDCVEGSYWCKNLYVYKSDHIDAQINNSRKGETFDGENSLYAWFSDDANRVPVYFLAPLKIGQVRGRLYSYEGLKYPFTSLTK